MGSEWRTFSNEKSTKDNSRVGAAEVSLSHFLSPKLCACSLWKSDCNASILNNLI